MKGSGASLTPSCIPPFLRLTPAGTQLPQRGTDHANIDYKSAGGSTREESRPYIRRGDRMDNMRRNAVSPRSTTPFRSVPAFRRKTTGNAAKYASDQYITAAPAVGTLDPRAFSGDSGSAAAINEILMSAVQHRGTISLDVMLRDPMVSRILDICRGLRGAKILTVCRDHDAAFTLHTGENGELPCNAASTRVLRTELSMALQHGGTFIIRQLLPARSRSCADDGKPCWINWKNVYAFNLGNNRFEAVPVAHLQYANTTGPDGEAVAGEQGVLFREHG